MNMQNHVQLIGHLGKDVEVFNAETDKMVGKTTLATSNKYKNQKGELVTNTEWHTIVLFRSKAKIASQYLKKGSHVMVTGSLKTRKYTLENGEDRYTTEIIADDLLFLDKK